MADTVTVLSRARVVCESCTLADTLWTRFRGLMGRKGLEPAQGLLLRPSSSVHTCFMRFPIDVVFLDGDMRVLAVAPEVSPWRLRVKRGARAVLELPAGGAGRGGVTPGDALTLAQPSAIELEEEARVLG